MKGRLNMTTCSFCQWINEELLLNEVLEHEKINVETTRKWPHHLEFHIVDQEKGIHMYINGHEQDNVVECRTEFI